MKSSLDSQTYVLIPEEVAAFLDQDSSENRHAFSFSAVDGDPDLSFLPRKSEVQMIRTATLSSRELAHLRSSDRTEHTVYPLVMYHPQVMSIGMAIRRTDGRPQKRPVTRSLRSAQQAATLWPIRVVDRISGRPLPGVTVTAFTAPGRTGKAEAVTNSNGEAVLPISSGMVEELFVLPPHTHWSRLGSSIVPSQGVYLVELDAMDPSVPSCLKLARGKAVQDGSGIGVRVGIIDTGVGPHPDIKVSGGIGPLSEPGGGADDCDLHGTHVAGVIASSGVFPGLAPNCEIRSYRVCRRGQVGATNADIVNALLEAIRDGCHLINMSLGATSKDPLIEKAVRRAMECGVLVIAASGNEGRKPIQSPARIPGVVSVSAMGCEKTYPRDSAHIVRECLPRGLTPTHYVANFSNTGNTLCCTAPGVGVISTVPPGGYLALDGTSMAAPVVTGIAACLLSANPSLLAQKADGARTKAMRTLLYTACASLGFPFKLEGKNGLPS